MNLRHIAHLGLLLVGVGCQSYFPNSAYGPYGPYNMPPAGAFAPPATYQGAAVPGTYAPPATAMPPRQAIPQGRIGSAAPVGLPNATPPKGSATVPKYPDAGAPGATLGKPADDGLDDFKNTTGSLGPSGARIDTITDDSEENLARLGDEAFASPMPLRSVAADELADGPLRQTVQSVPSPYLYDHDRHSWLRGVAHYDEFSESWRIVYSRDTADEDDYGGSLTMTGHPDLDKLRDNETILVEGIVDPNRPDRFGKPTYRVRKIRPITPKKATVAEKE
jgi:hypothetical protein